MQWLLIPLTTVQLILISVWTIICFPIALLFRLITFSDKGHAFVGKYTWSMPLVKLFGVMVKTEGKENIPKDGEFIFASNHQSYLDIPLLMQTCPKFLFFIAKKELKKLPVIGWAIKSGGMFFIDRSSNVKARETMLIAGEESIKKNKSIVTFPEGTRSLDGEVKLFRRGAFVLSKETGLPIVPCSIEGAFNVWPKGRLLICPGKVTVKYGKPFDPKDFQDTSIEEYAKTVEKEVVRMKG